MSWTLARIVSVRSDSTENSISAGMKRLSSGISAMMLSTVSMTLALACLEITSSTDGCALNHAAERVLRTLCSTEATADSRVTLPFEDFTTSVWYSRGSCIWSLIASVSTRSEPSITPTGPAALALTMVVRTSSMLTPMEAIATGLTRMRIAGCSEPFTVTSATPSTCEMRCAMIESAAS